jgi:hypothetical protein
MSVSAALLRGRAAAEALMQDTCTIRRGSGETTDPDTGIITPTYGDAIYEGKCRVQQRTATASAQQPGEAYVLMLQLEVQLPMSVVGLEVGDEVTITASVHDPDLVDRAFLIRSLAHKTHATARRVQVEERTS